MSASFDDQLLRSVLSGSAPTSKTRMPKVGEFGGEGSQNAATENDGENPLSPVPPYEEIDSSSSQQAQASSSQAQASSQPPPQPLVQAEGADGLISADGDPLSPSITSPEPVHVNAHNPDSFRAINDPTPVHAPNEESPYPGPTEFNRTLSPGLTDSKSPPPQVEPASVPTSPPVQTVVQQPSGNSFILHSAIPLYALQRDSSPVDCPRCRTRNLTKLSHNASTATHSWAIAAGVATIGLALAVPYFVKGTKNVTHSCPNCQAKLATHMHSGRTVIHCHA